MFIEVQFVLRRGTICASPLCDVASVAQRRTEALDMEPVGMFRIDVFPARRTVMPTPIDSDDLAAVLAVFAFALTEASAVSSRERETMLRHIANVADDIAKQSPEKPASMALTRLSEFLMRSERHDI